MSKEFLKAKKLIKLLCNMHLLKFVVFKSTYIFNTMFYRKKKKYQHYIFIKL